MVCGAKPNLNVKLAQRGRFLSAGSALCKIRYPRKWPVNGSWLRAGLCRAGMADAAVRHAAVQV